MTTSVINGSLPVKFKLSG